MLRNLGINHLVALLGLVLAICSYLALHRYGTPEKVCIGAAILCILVVAIFWSSVLLGADDDED
jgi:asparagine N-glycosylation enzyme membrane subunit Stt3